MTMPDGTKLPDSDAATGDSAPPAPGDSTDWKALYDSEKSGREEYEKKFKGLQRSYNDLRTESDGATQKAVVAETALEKLQGEHATAASTAEQLQTQNEQLKTDAASLTESEKATKAALERLNLVVTEFPSLLPFMAKTDAGEPVDLLPHSEDPDELKKALKVFETRMESQTHTDLTNKSKGATPPPPNGEGPEGLEQIRSRANTLLKDGKLDEYNAAMDKYYTMIQKTNGQKTT